MGLPLKAVLETSKINGQVFSLAERLEHIEEHQATMRKHQQEDQATMLKYQKDIFFILRNQHEELKALHEAAREERQNFIRKFMQYWGKE